MRSWTMAVIGLGGAVFALSLPALTTASAQEADWEDKPYIIEDGKIDYGTYNGYRRYHNTCHVCHGPDALGGSFAPSLKKSLETMSYADFLEVVTNGRQSKSSASQDSVMPSFAENTDVMLYIDHIYAYLKARADDVVGRGRPERLPAEEDPVYQEWQDSQ